MLSTTFLTAMFLPTMGGVAVGYYLHRDESRRHARRRKKRRLALKKALREAVIGYLLIGSMLIPLSMAFIYLVVLPLVLHIEPTDPRVNHVRIEWAVGMGCALGWMVGFAITILITLVSVLQINRPFEKPQKSKAPQPVRAKLENV